ncbi:MAG: putative quinol monooxygenase [Methyloceanibacter sp.]
MQRKVTVIAFHRAKPGKEQALREALLAVRAPTLKERGCINYDLHDSPNLPGVFVFLENWESKADFDAHIASAHIDAFRAKAPDLLAEPADITLWREIDRD